MPHTVMSHTAMPHTAMPHTGISHSHAAPDIVVPVARSLRCAARGSERGQASVEYALVLLGAALVALLLISWATNTNIIDTLLGRVMQIITSRLG